MMVGTPIHELWVVNSFGMSLHRTSSSDAFGRSAHKHYRYPIMPALSRALVGIAVRKRKPGNRR
jgi:hypothetical protein